MEKKEIFIISENNLESIEIIKLLKTNGYKKNKDFFITKQGRDKENNVIFYQSYKDCEDYFMNPQRFRANWKNLEPRIKRILEKNEIEIEVEDKTPETLDSKGSWKVDLYQEQTGYPGVDIPSECEHEYKTYYGTKRDYLKEKETDYYYEGIGYWETDDEDEALSSYKETSEFERDKLIEIKKIPHVLSKD